MAPQRRRPLPLSLVAGASFAGLALTSAAQPPAPPLINEVHEDDWLRQCVPAFKDGAHFPGDAKLHLLNYSNEFLRQEPSGLCSDILSCAFRNCAWTNDAKTALWKHDLEKTSMDALRKYLPPLNLPGKIAFPQGVADVVAALQYAKENHLYVSIKSGGHSYIGSSNLRGSLLLSMFKFPKYSPNGASIVLCDARVQRSDLDACRLAQARGKRAVVRIGGGEIFDDLYRGVLAWNAKQSRELRFVAVGGGAGSVGAAGGWLHGGGLSTHLDRTHGLGVDQVLKLEMVLADGTHVSFGPVAWESVEGYLYPKTTRVAGLCNSNVVQEESLWKWEACGKAIPFEKLWFAVRGGGGGTYGVVTAVTYQLHDQEDYSVLRISESAKTRIFAECIPLFTCDAAKKLMYDFFIDFFFQPAVLGVAEDVSSQCGSPSFAFNGRTEVHCQGRNASDTLFGAWKLAVGRKIKETPRLSWMKQALLNAWAEVPGSFESFPDFTMKTAVPYWPAGHVPDYPTPSVISDTSECWSSLVPKKWLVTKSDDVYTLFEKCFYDSHVLGGNIFRADDFLSSIPFAQRNAAVQACFPRNDACEGLLSRYQRLYLEYLPSGDDGGFPGFTEFNHIGFSSVGPLKSNWSTPCAFTAKGELPEGCISLQESVWGTKGLAKLAEVKAEVDPYSLFNCFGCVGYKDVHNGSILSKSLTLHVFV